ncbi:MAG: hypothetical protein GY730_08195 [bacterium]|nr:hypothetical protein [bacterium]
MNEKTGRNDPCPCGSDKKYKNCYLDKIIVFPHRKFSKKELQEIFLKQERQKALNNQKTKMQGLGKNIISSWYQGYRIVVVG